MGIPIVAGDIGTVYVRGDSVIPVATMIQGSPNVTINGKSPMLLGLAITSAGPLISSTLNTSKVTINGLPVMLSGSVTNLADGHSGGTLLGVNAIGVTME